MFIDAGSNADDSFFFKEEGEEEEPWSPFPTGAGTGDEEEEEEEEERLCARLRATSMALRSSAV